MNAVDHWIKASAWARKRFTCDHPSGCAMPIRRIHVKEGEMQRGYCFDHFKLAHGSLPSGGAK